MASRIARALIALVLILACAAVPLAAVWCAASCEAPQQATAAAPPCHHASSPIEKISGASTSCGHDHRAVPAIASVSSVDAAARSLAALPATVGVNPATVIALVAVASRASPDIPSRVSSVALALSSTLRI